MGGRGAGSGGSGKSIGFSFTSKGRETRIYSIPGSKTHVRIISSAGQSIQKVNGGINTLVKNAKKNGLKPNKITTKSEAEYQKKKQANRLTGFEVNGGNARRDRLQRAAMTRGRPDSRNGF